MINKILFFLTKISIMAQHFLLSSKAHTLSSYEIAQLSEEEAYDLLCELRWGCVFKRYS